MAKREFIQNLLLLLAGLGIILALDFWVFDSYQIGPQDANHYLFNGDQVLVTKNAKIKAGDFVLYQADGQDHIGRVIADQGDQVTYMDDLLYINNKIVDESYLNSMKDKYQSGAQNTGYFTGDFTLETLPHAESNTVSKNSYLILNDDRQDLKDSRTYGLIKSKDIRGVVDFRFLPLNRFGFVEGK